jgi:hypothetical protein
MPWTLAMLYMQQELAIEPLRPALDLGRGTTDQSPEAAVHTVGNTHAGCLYYS